MSFILDALRKSEIERQRQSGPSMAEFPVAREDLDAVGPAEVVEPPVGGDRSFYGLGAGDGTPSALGPALIARRSLGQGFGRGLRGRLRDQEPEDQGNGTQLTCRGGGSPGWREAGRSR